MIESMSNIRKSVLFLTYADRRYESFAVTYILSALSHVPHSVVEIFVDDEAAFTRRFAGALAALSGFFGQDRFRISQVDRSYLESRTLPNSIRFLVKPSCTAEFVYIGDIDIIVLDDSMVERHLDFMLQNNLPYSNSVRLTDQSRMSGLHFSRFNAYYPVPDTSDLDKRRLNDEMLLRILCERKNLPIQDKEWFRPVPGIHVSPNRQPLPSVNDKGRAIPGWDFEAHAWAYRRFRLSEAFQAVAPFFEEQTKDIFRTLDRAFLTMHWSQLRALSVKDAASFVLFRCAMAFLALMGRRPFGQPL